MENSGIEWTDHTANTHWGCDEVRPECDECYARKWAERMGWTVNNSPKSKGISLWNQFGPRLYQPGIWKSLTKFQKLAAGNIKTKTHFGANIQSVFVGSMMDIGEKPMPLVNHIGKPLGIDPNGLFEDDGQIGNTREATTDDLRQQLFKNIWDGVSEMYPNLLFLFLSKRPSNYKKIIPAHWFTNPPKNVMFGTSVGQESSLMMVDQLLATGPQFKYFLSCEPMIGGFSLRKYLSPAGYSAIRWVIVGGESGSERPFNLDWARVLRDECQSASVSYFFKQVDKVQPIPDDLMIREFPKFSV